MPAKTRVVYLDHRCGLEDLPEASEKSLRQKLVMTEMPSRNRVVSKQERVVDSWCASQDVH